MSNIYIYIYILKYYLFLIYNTFITMFFILSILIFIFLIIFIFICTIKFLIMCILYFILTLLTYIIFYWNLRISYYENEERCEFGIEGQDLKLSTPRGHLGKSGECSIRTALYCLVVVLWDFVSIILYFWISLLGIRE